MADIFISYSSEDRAWADWIGRELEALGHVAHVHDWEISAGGNIMEWMEKRHEDANHVLCIISATYLKKPYSSLERQAGQWAAVTARPNFVLPVLVEPSEVPTLLAPLKHLDLHGLGEADARTSLRTFLAPASKPLRAAFPGGRGEKPAGGGERPFPGRVPMEFRVVHDDILQATADVVALKFADHFYGADEKLSAAMGFSRKLQVGAHVFAEGKNIAAREVLFIGVGPIIDFRYQEIQSFGRRVMELTTHERPHAITLALTIHGPGYGLDEREAFLSLINGLQAAQLAPNAQLKTVLFYEQSAARATRLAELMQTVVWQSVDGVAVAEFNGANPVAGGVLKGRSSLNSILNNFGAKSEEKPRLFIAMPFADDYLDEYEIAFTEAAHDNGFLCERLDAEAFIGDIFSEIKNRIRKSCGIIALLNSNNPNVFLEIGFAMANDKPIVFVVKKGSKVPFDVQGQKCLEYTRINELRRALAELLSGLKLKGVFDTP